MFCGWGKGDGGFPPFFFWFGGVLLLGFVVPKVEVSSKLRCYGAKFSGCHQRMFISLLSQMAYRL